MGVSCHRSDVFPFLFLFWRSPLGGMRDGRDEIQRIKAGNPDISHREAFSAAAKNVSDLPLSPLNFSSVSPCDDFTIPRVSRSFKTPMIRLHALQLSEPLFGVVVFLLLQWAHFPHIHFGLMPDHHGLRKTNLLPQVISQSNMVMHYYLQNKSIASANIVICPLDLKVPW